MIASSGILISDSTWYGHYFAAKRTRYGGGNKRASMGGTFHHKSGGRHARYNAIATHKVAFIGIGARKVFGEQTAVAQHFACFLLMPTRINAIETMSKHAYRVDSIFQACTVCMNVYSVCQTTDYQRVWQHLTQIFYQTITHLLAIFRDVSCAHNADTVRMVERCCATIEQDNGSILHLPQAQRIFIATIRNHFDAVFLTELHFAKRTFASFLYPYCIA